MVVLIIVNNRRYFKYFIVIEFLVIWGVIVYLFFNFFDGIINKLRSVLWYSWKVIFVMNDV